MACRSNYLHDRYVLINGVHGNKTILRTSYLTFVCYPVAKSNNPTQGFSVMQVLTLLLANLDYT